MSDPYPKIFPELNDGKHKARTQEQTDVDIEERGKLNASQKALLNEQLRENGYELVGGPNPVEKNDAVRQISNFSENIDAANSPTWIAEWKASDKFTGIPPKREWLIEGLLLEGKAALLAAAGGVGKSFLLLELAVRTAAYNVSAGNFTSLGKLTTGGAVVMICAEDDSTEIHNRLRSIEAPILDNLYIIPKPDHPLPPFFELSPFSNEPIIGLAFAELEKQLKRMDNVKLIILDPLQALCGGVDLNLPQHSQYVSGALARLAAETGAVVIASHHLRKGGEIKTRADARDAIRGSGALVDGLRAAIVVWPESVDNSKKICNQLSVNYRPDIVCNFSLVKENFGGDLSVQTLVREKSGLLANRTFDLQCTTPKEADVMDKLMLEIEAAAERGNPFTHTGAENGISSRSEELSAFFQGLGRDKLKEMTQELLNKQRISKFKVAGKKGKTWLGMTKGALHIGSEK